MSGREFKPGDVALIRVGTEYPPEIAVRGGGIFDGKWYVGGPRFGSQHGWHEDRIEVIRPLVVIDPENREQVERLYDLLSKATPRTIKAAELGDVNVVRDRWVSMTQAALRELASPKPEEEFGLGAVDEEANTGIYTRYETPAEPQPWWQSAHGPEHDVVRRFAWEDINVVRVLSEGVTP